VCQERASRDAADGNPSTDAQRRLSASLPRGVFGLPGQFGRLAIVAIDASGNERGAHGGDPGLYRVAVTLWKPGFSPGSEGTFQLGEVVEGDSHLEVASPGKPTAVWNLDLTSDNQTLTYQAHSNSRGMLAKFVVAELQANSFADAESRAYSGLAPFLSHLATQFEIPLDIFQTEVKELKSETVSVTYVNPYYAIRSAGSLAVAVTPEIRGYLSVYRESLTSRSPFYQFLSFYKIVEELFKRRGRLGDEVRSGSRPRFARLRIPDDPSDVLGLLRGLYSLQPHWDELLVNDTVPPEAWGRSLKDVADQALRPIRDRIGHALFDTSGTDATPLQSFDDGEHLRAVHKWLAFVRTAARWLLKEDLGIQF
jgi:hypothetical protein